MSQKRYTFSRKYEQYVSAHLYTLPLAGFNEVIYQIDSLSNCSWEIQDTC